MEWKMTKKCQLWTTLMYPQIQLYSFNIVYYTAGIQRTRWPQLSHYIVCVCYTVSHTTIGSFTVGLFDPFLIHFWLHFWFHFQCILFRNETQNKKKMDMKMLIFENGTLTLLLQKVIHFSIIFHNFGAVPGGKNAFSHHFSKFSFPERSW